MDYNKKIQPDDFRYSLLTEGADYILKYSPIGWEGSTVSNKRDLDYWAVLKSFSVPLEFAKDGARIIRETLYNEGVDYPIQLLIEKLNRSTWAYESIFMAELDLSQSSDEISSIEVNLMEGGVPAKVSSYESVTYEIPFTEEDPEVSLGGVDLLEWANFLATSFSRLPSSNMAYYFPATQLVNYSMILGGLETRDQNLMDGASVYDYTTGDNFFLSATAFNGVVRVKGYIIINAQQEANNGWEIQIRDSSQPSGFRVVELISTLSEDPQQYTGKRYEFDELFTVMAGRKYFLTVESILPQNFAVNFCDIVSSEISLDYTQISDGITIKAKHPKTLFKELISTMTESDVIVESNILDEWDNLLITSGDSLRGLESAVIKTSFQDFFKSMNAVISIGFGFENSIPTIESKEYFFDNNNQILNIGDVKNPKVSPLVEVMNSAILAGYSKEDYDVERGREEFNQGQEYSTPIIRVQTKLDIRSPYRADQYGMDEVRINELKRDANAKDTDNKSDNDVFMIHCYKGPATPGLYTPIGKEAFSSITGVSDRSNSYNYLLSPKRNLIRHLTFIKSMFYGSSNDSGVIRFTSADKNSDLSTTLVGELAPVLEKADIDISSIPDRLFLPFEVEFETDYPINFQQMLNSNSNGYITFVYMGYSFKGFIKEVEVDLAKNTSSVMKVILSKDNDLTKLIH